MEAVLIVLGAFVGALATGGVQTWDAWRERQLSRKVAARIILGDLYVAEAMFELVLQHDRWPDRLDFQAPITTWRESRRAFAGGVEAWEWAFVDGLFSNLHRTSLMIRAGEHCTPTDRDVLRSVLQAIAPARDVVLRHATTEAERERVITEIGAAATRL